MLGRLARIVAVAVSLMAVRLAASVETAADCAEPQTRPNVLFILADDLRADGLHALGAPIVKTPNLDRLVEAGFRFRCAYTQGSNVGAVCLPSRTMIQTGQSYLHPRRDVPSWAQTVRGAGYASIRSGKFGNNPNSLDADFDQHLDGANAQGNADNLIAFIRQHAGRKPLFLYMASPEPHDPQFAPPEYYAMYKPAEMPMPVNFLPFHPFDNGEMTVRDEMTLPWPRTRENLSRKLARYCASTAYLDAQVGRVLEALRETGQWENTLFIVAGDNGLSLGEHGLLGKQNLYEFGGMHVPLVFSGKGVPKGDSHALAYLYDLYPTMCEWCGVHVPHGLDGKSLAPVLQGKTAKVRDWALTAYRDVQRAIRNDRWKLIRYPQIDKTQLFDLHTDPREMNDLAAKPEYAGRIKELTARLQEQQRAFGDECPLSVPQPREAAWSPAKLTVQDLAAQREETAVSAGEKARKRGSAKPKPRVRGGK
jgi:arylsulfatase A-like enzyme